MNTLILNSDKKGLEKSVELLSQGQLVAIPTETVYGLAADATNKHAVTKIFEAKGRPQDNPLIVHIADINDWPILVDSIPKKAQILANKFWPGPLTIILKKSNFIPNIVTANLDRIAVRMPDSNLVRDIIRKLKKPLAAPSANTSGKPSPTCMAHVLEDLDTKISAVIDGGECSVGLESTVIDINQEKIRFLRPGIITEKEISEIIGEKIEIDSSIYTKTDNNTMPIYSPGMKYKHYAPKTKIILIECNSKNFVKFVNSKSDCAALCFDEEIEFIDIPVIPYGKENSPNEQAKKIFNYLRKLDNFNLKLAYVHAPKRIGKSLAVFNRLIRASGFKVIRLPE
ncbi:MAG: threonylcarbamoyl-AMP synthase [Oscillospiraceae bacterium]|jgi:L-threonylcarbamoyladenylate synthase|nr:threonylcarbamoyl-AMP synthase [Oscillospiraceae bacterium]